MILDVKHLEMVRAIDEEGTLTEAARKLDISQPAMSRQLASLEREIGALVFQRHHKGMTLTQEGHRILESARRVLAELERAEEDVKLLAEGRAGTLRVATECYTGYHWLPWVARSFSARYPNVELQIVPEATKQPYEALATRALDLALVYDARSADENIVLEEIFRDELVAVVAEDHPLAREPYVTAERLRDETILCHYLKPGRGPLDRELFDPEGIGPKRTIELLVTPAVVEMARAGYGVAVGPRWILGGVTSLDGLRVLSLTEGGVWRSWLAATLASRRDEPLLGCLLEVLRAELADADAEAPSVMRGARVMSA